MNIKKVNVCPFEEWIVVEIDGVERTFDLTNTKHNHLKTFYIDEKTPVIFNLETRKLGEICNMCEGEGEYKNGFDDAFGNTTSFVQCCESCEGTGIVDLISDERKKELDEAIDNFINSENRKEVDEAIDSLVNNKQKGDI